MKKFKILKIIAFVLTSLTAVYISILNLGSQYMWSDEVYSFEAAKMIIEKGKPLYDSGLYYSRALIYHKLLAFSMEIFGENEFGSRIINLPFLIGTAVLVGIFVYILLKKENDNTGRNTTIGFLSGLIYYISNFSIAMLRETRMYTFSTFLFLLAVYLFYKAVVEPPKKGSINIPWFNFKFNIYYAFACLIVWYTAFTVQPINILLGLGIIVFLIIFGMIKKNYKYLLISLLCILAGFIFSYKIYGSFNVLTVLREFSPDWAVTFTPLYYSILTIRNFPFVLFTIPMALYFFLKKKDINISYFLSLLFVFWSFLSTQPAQHERYWQDVVPLLIIISVYACFIFFKEVKKVSFKTIFIILISLSLIFHVYLSVKECSEVDTYTPHSIGIQKKLQFNVLFDYLDEHLKESDILIADYHSAYTLYEKGYNIDYLLLQDDNVNIKWGKEDLYFDIPILKYSDIGSIVQGKTGYIILRDYDAFGNIPGEKILEFTRPEVYKF